VRVATATPPTARKEISIMKYALCAVLALSLGLLAFAPGCSSSKDPGVKTNYMSQWANVEGNTEAATNATKDVLTELGLKDVSATSTAVDGKVTAKKADGTKVKVDISKITDTTSKVEASIGTVGEPALGEEIVKKVKDKLTKK
jgi:hypothetical protein